MTSGAGARTRLGDPDRVEVDVLHTEILPQ
jgi:hypothetical protein